ncbi:MAG: hypothetical protein U0903_00645 [Planctomycetales bacterium]
MTVDLQFGPRAFSAMPSTTVANEYTLSIRLYIKNEGTTAADLTGQRFNVADNVHVRMVLSADAIYGNAEDVELATTFFSGPRGDTETVTLEPGTREF